MERILFIENIVKKYRIAPECDVATFLNEMKAAYNVELEKCRAKELSFNDGSGGNSARSSIASVSQSVERQRRRAEYMQQMAEEMVQWRFKINDVDQDLEALNQLDECQPSTSTDHSDLEDDIIDCADSSILMDNEEVQERHGGKKFKIIRPVYTQHEFDLNHGGDVNKLTWQQKVRNTSTHFRSKYCSRTGIKNFWLNRFPFIMIFKNYKWKEWIAADLIAGVLIGVMQIPQGMGYALLAGLDAQYGLYVSFFPSLMYFFLGTSRHDSMGTVAVISLLSGNYLSNSLARNPINITTIGNLTEGYSLAQMKAMRAAGLTFCVGIFHLLMSVFQLGFLTRYLSDPLISGFTVGAALSVLTSQIFTCFGLTIAKQNGDYNIPMTYYLLFKNISTTNMITLTLTLVCVAILVIFKEFINPRVVKKIGAPIPMDLIMVVAGTLVSYYLNLKEKYHVSIMGNISSGLPYPVMPDLTYMTSAMSDIFVMAIISFSISVSLAKIFAKKHCYQIEPNQELIAMGVMNVFSSFFLCYTAAASVSRTTVQDSIGGKTQVTSMVSTICVLLVVLFVGPLFYSLPSCILASIIVVALKGMFVQFLDVKELWLFSWWDLSIWIVTFLAAVIVDIQYGLMAGVVLSILIVMLRTQSPRSHILGQIAGTDIYKNKSVYDQCQEINGIKIFRYEGSIYYASSEHFKRTLYKKVMCNPRQKKMNIVKLQRKLKAIGKQIESERKKNPDQVNEEMLAIQTNIKTQLHQEEDFNVNYVILDCSTWGYIDTMGVKTLHQVIEEYRSIKVTVLLANPKTDIREMFARSKCYKELDDQIVFVSVHDAVINCLYDHKQKMEEREPESVV